MKSHVQAVSTGGGVVGASARYHLARYGWKDVALLERKDLTAGSAWQAAVAFHVVNSDINVSLSRYSAWHFPRATHTRALRKSRTRCALSSTAARPWRLP